VLSDLRACWLPVALLRTTVAVKAATADPPRDKAVNTKIAQIVMVGAFPPPVHGMGMVNVAVRAALQKAGVEPLVLDLAAANQSRALADRLGRLPKVARRLARLIRARGLHGATLYMSVSGGLGQVYEVLFALLARTRRIRVFLHHHSFAYLDAPSLLTWCLVRVAGSDAVHITLSPKMAERLNGVYGAARVVPVSNAVFFVPPSAATPIRSRLQTLGFLSNIAPEKGVFEFLDLCAAARDSGLPLRARLAGPFQDDETEQRVRARLVALPEVDYVGPKYGAEKDDFYAGIDVLMFPTRYVNEAEPVTLHEAMSRAVPVIAYGRGCIPEFLGPDCGLVIDPAAPFVPAALAQIETWLVDPAAFEAASQAAARRFAKTYVENTERWTRVLAEIAGRLGR
jgi:glycosyltransferase involved in cell wall biosynthesis